MVFSSLEFALFLPVFLLLYYAVIDRARSRELLLLVASYFFYMAFYWKYAGLLVLVTVLDYWLGLFISGTASPKRRRLLVVLSVISNLSLLGFFKYFNFFAGQASVVARWFGFDADPVFLHIILPAGISFHTFQSMSYTIDVYRREIPAERSLVKFAVFVSMFPQLVAGPIVRAAQFLPQMHRTPVVTRENLRLGWYLIFLGLFKKIAIADQLANLGVDAVFESPSQFSSWDLLMGLYGYAFQIYCDFSGYSDVAIGLALILGFQFPTNFNRPYLAQNPSDFWRRWHITLSTWLRDYLYIPLGGNREGQWRTVRNLMLTMLLGGLWHGAAWNFVLWGGFHGVILVLTRNLRSEASFKWRALRNVFIMFHVTLAGWLLFRVTSMSNLHEYLTGLGQLSGGSRLSILFYLIVLVSAAMHFTPVHWAKDTAIRWLSRAPQYSVAGAYALMLIALWGLSTGSKAFIYFQF